MRFCPAFLLLFPICLTACEPALEPGPRVSFVGSSRFNPASRRITAAGDTIAVKVFAEAGKDDAPLTHLVIKAHYQPRARPLIYTTTYEEGEDSLSFRLTYLDTLIQNANEFAFQSVQPARTTAGKETWTYTFTDSEGKNGVRSLYLRLGRTDSAAAYHSYTVPLQAPGAFGRRSFLALREGLALPSFSLRTLPDNQKLVDLVYVPGSTTINPGLATTTDAGLKLPWVGRATELYRTPLTASAFTNYATTEDLTNIVTQYQNQRFTPTTRTGPLTKDQVIAFRTPDNKYGLLLVQDIITTGIRTLVLQVRITK
ncbi:hypothetical protein [Hymenobacter metallilatus]|uniref:DUF4249 family protein n=1 Tax=Hymenobacter metallilatus TaxID=2493666 RepID=A0A428JF45_9BACT|nr:hypothetical protein [Hymenobacter metallilatus]RSK31176.1 hypothetical protein EI290_14235 [Hymenobacter metallilatus]